MEALCSQFNCLPRAGGLFDQDPFVMHGMGLVRVARQEIEEAKAAHERAKANAKKQGH